MQVSEKVPPPLQQPAMSLLSTVKLLAPGPKAVTEVPRDAKYHSFVVVLHVRSDGPLPSPMVNGGGGASGRQGTGGSREEQ